MYANSLIHSEYFYSVSSSPLLLRGAPNFSIDIVSELPCQKATGNKWCTVEKIYLCILQRSEVQMRKWQLLTELSLLKKQKII